jgi:hypothetical protein
VTIKLRVARPTNNLQTLADMYLNGIGLQVLSEFTDHDGFDGIILGHPSYPYHLEFTSERSRKAEGAPSSEHLLIFYVPNQLEWEQTCDNMLAAGFKQVSSHNPFWELQGKTFEDMDGYRVVLQHGEWSG